MSEVRSIRNNLPDGIAWQTKQNRDDKPCVRNNVPAVFSTNKRCVLITSMEAASAFHGGCLRMEVGVSTAADVWSQQEREGVYCTRCEFYAV